MTLHYSLVAVAALFAVNSASAALYTLTTGSSATASGIVNSAGVAFQNSANAAFAGPGYVSFGTFVGMTDAEIVGASFNDLVAAFRVFGTGGTFTAPGLSANRGTFSRAENVAVAGSIFAGMPIYVFAGNAAGDLAASAEFLLLKTAWTFDPAQDADPLPRTLTIDTTNTQTLFGTIVPDVRTTGTDASATPGWMMVPEPSVALLGALGVFGLLRRRR